MSGQSEVVNVITESEILCDAELLSVFHSLSLIVGQCVGREPTDLLRMSTRSDFAAGLKSLEIKFALP